MSAVEKRTACLGGRRLDTAGVLQKNILWEPQLEGQLRAHYFATKFGDYKEWEEEQEPKLQLQNISTPLKKKERIHTGLKDKTGSHHILQTSMFLTSYTALTWAKPLGHSTRTLEFSTSAYTLSQRLKSGTLGDLVTVGVANTQCDTHRMQY